MNLKFLTENTLFNNVLITLVVLLFIYIVYRRIQLLYRLWKRTKVKPQLPNLQLYRSRRNFPFINVEGTMCFAKDTQVVYTYTHKNYVEVRGTQYGYLD